ncbi:ATP-dependent DNA helicase RecG [Actinopolymorpha alba]|uniref:ATP-dependent DNA helicase RecG n=1 Tax=Actinopolymorpha alba TaxID=533267 RepID=UPI000361B026|nr:ATP-dependent DNA helicase RecG [Actinopolymorpha alba]
MAKIRPLRPNATLGTHLLSILTEILARPLREKLDLVTFGDMLRHYPRRYVQRGELTDLGSLQIGEEATAMVEVASVRHTDAALKKDRKRKLHIVDVVVTDGRGQLSLKFFNQPWRKHQINVGMRALVAGKVETYRGQLQLTHPDFVTLTDDPEYDENLAEGFAGRLMPIYPSTTAVPTWTIARIIRHVLDGLRVLPDPIPPDVRERHGLPALRDAYFALHRPADWDDVKLARKRFRFEEAFVLQTELARRRSAARELPAVPRVARADGLLAAFDARLPFELTDGQQEVGTSITADLARDHPMQRLLQGEVGSGKTVCAIRAMLTVVDVGGQAALLAPTEVLAQQHHRSITQMLGPLAERGFIGGAEDGTRVVLLTGSQSTAVRRKALLEVASGAAGLVVGTHALLEDKVQFADLGLVVIDEQHRFGVEQRAALTAKTDGAPPHVLVMTATPIPRTVAMTVFGDLEVSTLTELPRGRASIQTSVVPVTDRPAWLDRVWLRVREEVATGRQAYVVCPRIGDDGPEEEIVEPDGTRPPVLKLIQGGLSRTRAPSSRAEAVALIDLAAALAEGPLAGLRVEVLHGRLPSDAKDSVMRKFAAGEIDVLVATTVIEVGVDVPNASTMVVMDADWFGVSQLHQLRGRIGRGAHPGLCLLVTGAETGSPARTRLDAVASTSDGFELSRLDLEQRREGDVLGADQSGRRSSLRMLSVIRDEAVIQDARTEASAVVEQDPELRSHPALQEAVRALYEDDRADYLEKT